MADAARFIDNCDGVWLLQGELDFASVPVLLQHASSQIQGSDRIEVNLEGVTRANSAGLALLLEWLRESELAGRSISFVNVPAQLLSIARVCGLDEILSFKCQGSSGAFVKSS